MILIPTDQEAPCFVLLVASAALSFALFTASVPLLPVIFSLEHAVRLSAVCILAFLLPSLPLHPLISRLSRKRLLSTLPVSCLLPSSALLLISISLSFARSHVLRRAAFVLAFFILGCAYAVLQATIFRLVDYSIIAASHPLPRHTRGLQLAFVEACINIAVIIAPPLLAFMVQTTASHALPYYFAVIAQLSISVRVCCKLNARSGYSASFEHHPDSQYHLFENSPLLISERSNRPSNITEEISSERSQSPSPLYEVLRHPWSWLVMLAMLASSASLAFLRPLLTTYVMQARDGTLMQAATLFSTLGVATFVTEVVITVWLAERFGSTTTLVMGLVIMTVAFPFLCHPHVPLMAVVALVGIGSSATFVVSLTEMAATADVSINRSVETTSLVAAMFFTIAESLGTVFAPLLSDVHGGSFSTGVSSWSKFLLVSCGAVGVPYLIGTLVQCFNLVSCASSLSRQVPRKSPSSTTFATWIGVEKL